VVVGKPKSGFYNEDMLLKCNWRTKDGMTHHYWNVVASRRLSDGPVVQRQGLYLAEINDSQH
jgi:hypothetical protein